MTDPDPQEPIRRLTALAVELAAAAPNQTEAVTEVMLGLNQLAAVLGRAEAGEPRRVLTALYSHLTRLAGEGEEAATKVLAMLELLNDLAAEGRLNAATAVPGSLPQFRTDMGGPRYYVRLGSRGERLVETREGSEKDFYVTREDYEAAMEALARTARPHALFEPLHEAFMKAGGSPTKSAYPLRVVLRFLRQLAPPLIAGQRGRYRLTTTAEQFRTRARQAWHQLPQD